MKQGDAQTRAAQTQQIAAVGRAVVQIQSVGRTVPPHRAHHQSEHVDLALGRVGLQRHHVARGVVQHAVHPQRQAPRARGQRQPVAHVPVPQRAGPLGLPAQPCARARRVAQRHSIEPVLKVQPSHRDLGDGAFGQPPVGHQRAQDHRHGGRRVLPADVEQKLARGLAQRAGPAAIVTGLGAQGLQTALAKGIEPSLQRGDREGARVARSGRAKVLVLEGTQLGEQLSTLQGSARQRADDLCAKEGDLLGVVARLDLIHRSPWGTVEGLRCRRRLLPSGPVQGSRSNSVGR